MFIVSVIVKYNKIKYYNWLQILGAFEKKIWWKCIFIIHSFIHNQIILVCLPLPNLILIYCFQLKKMLSSIYLFHFKTAILIIWSEIFGALKLILLKMIDIFLTRAVSSLHMIQQVMKNYSSICILWFTSCMIMKYLNSSYYNS